MVGNYVLIDDQMTWSDGNDYCTAQYGTSLATITDDEDAQILFDLATAGTDAWIGLNEVNGEWVWASGYPWFVWMCSLRYIVCILGNVCW